jgi:hypothetical protein
MGLRPEDVRPQALSLIFVDFIGTTKVMACYKPFIKPSSLPTTRIKR